MYESGNMIMPLYFSLMVARVNLALAVPPTVDDVRQLVPGVGLDVGPSIHTHSSFVSVRHISAVLPPLVIALCPQS